MTNTTVHGAGAILSDTDRAFVDQHRVARLATADAHGAPHAVPVVYARLGNLLYFVVDDKPKRTHTKLKRLLNIAENPQVAVIIDHYDEDWTRLAYLLIQGDADVVIDRSEYVQALAALRGRYSQYEAMPLAFDTHPMVRITPRRRHLWRADSHTGIAT